MIARRSSLVDMRTGVIAGGTGYNLPQEASRELTDAVIAVG
jgi:hypothetical protein